MSRPVTRWGLLWRQCNLLDGETTHIVMREYMPALFHTRQQARVYASERFGYIKASPDLRREPYGWRLPIPIRVTIDAKPAQSVLPLSSAGRAG